MWYLTLARYPRTSKDHPTARAWQLSFAHKRLHNRCHLWIVHMSTKKNNTTTTTLHTRYAHFEQRGYLQKITKKTNKLQTTKRKPKIKWRKKKTRTDFSAICSWSKLTVRIATPLSTRLTKPDWRLCMHTTTPACSRCLCKAKRERGSEKQTVF